jgi:hypothetical protein
VVGGSRGFWQHFYPELQRTFRHHLGQVGLETFYRAINKVDRSLIPVDADEVTYNLHIMPRFDLAVSSKERLQLFAPSDSLTSLVLRGMPHALSCDHLKRRAVASRADRGFCAESRVY